MSQNLFDAGSTLRRGNDCLFLCRRNIRLRAVTYSLAADQSISVTEHPKIPCERLFFEGAGSFCYPLGLCWPASSNSSTHADANTGRNSSHAVGMGGLDFFDKNDAEKNRIAEVWLVAP